MAPIILGTILMDRFGLSWETALGVLGLVGVAYGLLFWTAYPRPAGRAPGVKPSRSRSRRPARRAA